MSTAITGISSMATRVVLGELAQMYEAVSGIPVVIKAMGGVDAARLIRAGEATDIVILASNVMTQLEAEGRIVPGSIKDFALSGMAIAVPAGARWPDISTEDAVRAAVLAARKVCYSTGPSGDHVLELCTRWGLLPEKSERLIKAPPGVPVAALLAQGDADLGFQQLSELIHAPGIEVVGPLPPRIQAMTVFAAGISMTSSQAAKTRDFIAYLTSPAANDVKHAQGMAAGAAE